MTSPSDPTYWPPVPDLPVTVHTETAEEFERRMERMQQDSIEGKDKPQIFVVMNERGPARTEFALAAATLEFAQHACQEIEDPRDQLVWVKDEHSARWTARGQWHTHVIIQEPLWS